MKTPAVTVDLSKFKKHELPDVRKIGDVAKYTSALTLDELVVDVVLIGQKYKVFKDWFAEHAEFVWELRSRLPERGPNAIEIRTDKGTKTYLWSEFCVEFFGVSDEWVRRQLCLYEGMKKHPKDFSVDAPKSSKSESSPNDKADTIKVSKLSWETLELQAQTYALRYAQAVSELQSLLKLIEQVGDKVPMSLITYVRDLENRLAAMTREPKSSMNHFAAEELDVNSKSAGGRV